MSTRKKPATKPTPSADLKPASDLQRLSVSTPAETLGIEIHSIPERIGRFDGQGLTLAADLTIVDWQAVGVGFARVHAASGWALGDWLNYGLKWEKVEGTKGAYKAAIAATGIDYARLRTFASIAKRFPSVQRREGLSFEHHRLLATVKDDKKVAALMDRVQNEKLSAAATREIVPKVKPKKLTDEQKAAQAAARDEKMRTDAQALTEYLSDLPTAYAASWKTLLSELGSAVEDAAALASAQQDKQNAPVDAPQE